MTAAYRPLAHVLIRRIVLLATACALLLSAAQGVLTYRQVQQRFEATLQDIVSSLGLPVQVLGQRVQDVLQRQRFQLVTARAVGAIDRLLPWFQPLWLAGAEFDFTAPDGWQRKH